MYTRACVYIREVDKLFGVRPLQPPFEGLHQNVEHRLPRTWCPDSTGRQKRLIRLVKSSCNRIIVFEGGILCDAKPRVRGFCPLLKNLELRIGRPDAFFVEGGIDSGNPTQHRDQVMILLHKFRCNVNLGETHTLMYEGPKCYGPVCHVAYGQVEPARAWEKLFVCSPIRVDTVSTPPTIPSIFSASTWSFRHSSSEVNSGSAGPPPS